MSSRSSAAHPRNEARASRLAATLHSVSDVQPDRSSDASRLRQPYTFFRAGHPETESVSTEFSWKFSSSSFGQFVKETLGDKIKEAKVSHRLKTHPVCLTAGEGFSFEMEKYFKNFQMPEPIKAERILELNVDHPAVKAMAAALATDRDKAALYAKILYDQANLIAGLPLEDPSVYTDMVAQLMQ